MVDSNRVLDNTNNVYILKYNGINVSNDILNMTEIPYRIVEHYIEKNSPSIKELKEKFKDCGSGNKSLILEKDNISTISRKDHYFRESSRPNLQVDGVEFGVYTQWYGTGKNENFKKFIKNVSKLGYEVIQINLNTDVKVEYKEFIDTIKTTKMDKSYKIPLLWAFYNNGNIKLKIDENDIYNSFKEFYSKEENTIDLQDLKSTEGYRDWNKKQWYKFVKDRPIKYLSEGDQKYFYKEEKLFCISKKIEPYIKEQAFINEFKKAIEILESKYFGREIKLDEDKIIIKDEEAKYMESKIAVNNIQSYIKNQGYNYTYKQVSNLYLSLKTKPFTILAGISGTGKSKIIKLLSDSLNADYTLISVRPDWNDSTDLIGYKNLKDQFIKGQLVETILKAKENKNKMHFICLDEMNLARVEYYLSDYLSIIESRKKVGQDIITDNIVQYEENNEIINLHIPDNLYLIGTVNMDDTTFQFSRKVLDRANTIEFSDVDLDNLFPENSNEEIESLNISNNFLKTTYLKTMDIEEEYREYAKEVNKNIIQINNILKKSQKQFAYRVRDEILFYMVENKKANLLDENTAFDYQIM